MHVDASQQLCATIMTAVLIFSSVGQHAFADNVQNDVVVGGNDTIYSGGSTTINYRITANNGDGQTGCNAADSTPATLTINSPASVSKSTSSLTFTGCGTNKPVTLSSSVPGNYVITVSVSDGGVGTYNVNPATFTLHVLTPPDTTPPVIAHVVTGTLGSNGWYIGDVTVTWTVTDSESTITSTSGCNPSTTSSDTAGTTLTCTATSAGGTASSSVTIKRDATAPSITATASPSPNVNGWNNGDVTVHFTCIDSGPSGIASCPSDVNLTAESDGSVSTTGVVIDDAGNSMTVSIAVKIDKTSPTISAMVSPAANSAGWHNSDVTVSFTCSDSLSDIESCSGPVLLSEGAGQSATGGAADKAGNSATITVQDINIDKTAPTITGSASPAPNANGWNNGSVAVSFSCTDALSGVASCGPDSTLSTEGASQSVTGTAVDVADNAASASVEGINIDMTPPTITGSRTPGANSNGWNKEDVTVHFDCADTLSGIVSCPADTVLNIEGANQAVSGVATDKAANSASATVGGINIDKTNPVNVAFTNGGITNGGLYYFGFVPAGPTACSAVDGLSGMDRCEVSGGGTSVGSHSYTATAYDRAGNSATFTIHYTVNKWTINGFYQPLDMNGVQNVAKAGKVIPTKWSLYAGTTELTDTSTFDSMGWKSITCGTSTATDAIETYATDTGNTELRYDPVSHQFVKNIKVPTSLGCYQLVLRTDDGSFIGAIVNVK